MNNTTKLKQRTRPVWLSVNQPWSGFAFKFQWHGLEPMADARKWVFVGGKR